MNDDEFRAYCEQMRFSAETIATITRVRKSPPSRAVQSGRHNVIATYPSRKMGVTIQAESHTVELLGIYDMERDPNVLEYYNQPPSITLRYIDKHGHKQGHMHTPDFFVIRKDGAGWVEWKDDEDIAKLAIEKPFRFVRLDNGQWQSPPGEAVAKPLGLSYAVRTPASLDIALIRNWKFLADYMGAEDLGSDEKVKERVKRLVAETPGISLQALLETDGLAADDLLMLIAHEDIFVDLSGPPLSDPGAVHVYSSRIVADAYGNARASYSAPDQRQEVILQPNALVLFDGRLLSVVICGQKEVTFRNESDQLIHLALPHIQRLVHDGLMIGVSEKVVAAHQEQATNLKLKSASPSALAIANARYELITNPQNEQSPLPLSDMPVARSRRSLRRLKRKFALEKAATGSGYPALIPRIDQRGNRTRRLEAEVESLIQETIDAYFVVPQRPSVSHVYNTHLVPACKERNLPVPSRKTFYTRIKRQPVHPVAKVRLGVRGAYALEPALLELSIHLPKHGDRPFEVAHIDHTQADIELMNSTFTTNLGRPWISVAICAYSRRILAIYISFDPPSQISVMMLLRLIVQRWNRLPEAIVVDGGREFQSVYFEKLLAHYEITKIVRPKSKPRFGSVIERAFGTINTELFNNLAGNTQIMKNIRWVTKDNNPKREAVWTLPALHKALEYWGNEIYDIKIHSGLGRSPSEQFALGTWFSGSRPMRFIPYTTDFIISTYPTTQKGTARVQANVGVKINGVYYYCDAMRKVIKADVFVRYDPFDLGVAYAYIQGEWMKCYSQYRAKFLHLSEREREHITKELKKRGTANREFNELFFRKWGDLANIIAQTEAWGRLSKQQAENRMVRELTGGSPIPDEPQIFDVVIAHDVMVEEKRPAELRPGANNKVVDYGEL